MRGEGGSKIMSLAATKLGDYLVSHDLQSELGLQLRRGSAERFNVVALNETQWS